MASGLLRTYRATRSGMREDFRGSRWGTNEAQVLQTEMENLREGWRGTSELFGMPVMFRYTFGPAGLRGGTYEFALRDEFSDASVAFRHVLAALMKQHQLPAYLQQTPAVLLPDVELPPMSLLRSMAQGGARCIAAWAMASSEVLLIKDESTSPLRLLCNARDATLYPDISPRPLQALPSAQLLQ